jgi:sugar/nucleoside kinase (ribokinase family)
MFARISNLLVVGAIPFGRSCPPQRGIGNALLGAIGAWIVGANVAIAAVIGPTMQSPMLRGISAAGIDVSRVRTAASEEVADALPKPEALATLERGWGVHLAPMPARHQRALLSAAAPHASTMTVDVSQPPGGAMLSLTQLSKLGVASDALIIGQRDAETLWPGQSPREVLEILANRGAQAAIMRLGGGAAIGITNETVVWMPGMGDIDVSITRATDAYGAAFAAAFTRNPDLPEAMAWAGAASAALAQSRDPLELMNPYARRSVEAGATLLQAQAGRLN